MLIETETRIVVVRNVIEITHPRKGVIVEIVIEMVEIEAGMMIEGVVAVGMIIAETGVMIVEGTIETELTEYNALSLNFLFELFFIHFQLSLFL